MLPFPLKSTSAFRIWCGLTYLHRCRVSNARTDQKCMCRGLSGACPDMPQTVPWISREKVYSEQGSRSCSRNLTSMGIYPHQLGYVFGRERVSVCPSVCPLGCEQNNSKSDRQILMKFSGNVQHGKRKNWFHFGVDLDQRLAAMMKNVILVNNYWTKIDIIMNPIGNGMFPWSKNLKI